MIDLQLHAAFNVTNIDDLTIYGILRYASARQSKKCVFQKFKIRRGTGGTKMSQIKLRTRIMVS